MPIKVEIVDSKKKCHRCGEFKDMETEYNKSSSNRYGVQSTCRDCDKQKQLECRFKYPARQLFKSARRRAKDQGLPFTITEDDIVIPEYCPVLGYKLKMSTGGTAPNSPSLDKIVPARGYVPGNIQVISQRANLMKYDASIEDLRAFAEWVRKEYGSSTSGLPTVNRIVG
jgi:hypothetical protein